MNSQRRPLLLVLIVGAFFIAGLATVLLGGSESGPQGEVPDQSGSVVVLGVDDLGAEEPRLVALWHASFDPAAKELLLLGQPVDRPVCLGSDTTLEELFRWRAGAGLGPDFLETLGKVPYVVVDERGFAAVVDELQGVELGGAQLQGDQVVALLGTLYGNPAASVTSQEQFLIAMADRARTTSPSVDLNTLLELMPEHAYTSVPPQDLLTLYLGLQPLEEAEILVFAQPADPPDC